MVSIWLHASLFLQLPGAWELVTFRNTGLWPRSRPCGKDTGKASLLAPLSPFTLKPSLRQPDPHSNPPPRNILHISLVPIHPGTSASKGPKWNSGRHSPARTGSVGRQISHCRRKYGLVRTEESGLLYHKTLNPSLCPRSGGPQRRSEEDPRTYLRITLLAAWMACSNLERQGYHIARYPTLVSVAWSRVQAR